MGFFSRKSKSNNKELYEHVSNAVDMVKFGLAYSITSECESSFGEQGPAVCAAAVNMVFYEALPKPFMSDDNNVKKVRSIVANIRTDKELCSIITEAVLTRCSVTGKIFKLTPEKFEQLCKNPIQQIKNLGIFDPNVKEQPDINDFLNRAGLFVTEKAKLLPSDKK